MGSLKLYGQQGWGSALIEAQLAWYDVPFTFHAVGDLFADEGARRDLAAINPLAQIPTLVLPDGTVMTESAAITLWLADKAGSADLVPEPAAPQRAAFLRWLIFIVGNIYPTYTYADDPARFVQDEAAQRDFADAVGDYAKKLYGILDATAAAPWFLGDRFSALDIYVCTLTHWRPRRPWFAANTQRLIAIADATKAIDGLAPVWERNFPSG